MSIILASVSVKSAIFDSLAITFVVELGDYALEFYSTVFHLEKIENYEFRLETEEVKNECTCAKACGPTDGFLPLKFLHRGHGGRKFEALVSSFIMFLIYYRQLFVVVHAVDTNILPVARDICTLWRWQGGHERSMAGAAMLFRWLQSYFLLLDPTPEIDMKANPSMGGYCNESFRRMQTSDDLLLVEKYPQQMVCGISAILVCLILPQVFYAANAWIRTFLYKEEDKASIVNDLPPDEDLLAQVQNLRGEMEMLKHHLEKMETPHKPKRMLKPASNANSFHSRSCRHNDVESDMENGSIPDNYVDSDVESDNDVESDWLEFCSIWRSIPR